MKIITLTLIFAFSLTLELQENLKTEFQKFKIKYNKRYRNESEENRRFKIFSKNWKDIQQHNSTENISFTKAINQFADKQIFEMKSLTLTNFESSTGIKLNFINTD